MHGLPVAIRRVCALTTRYANCGCGAGGDRGPMQWATGGVQESSNLSAAMYVICCARPGAVVWGIGLTHSHRARLQRCSATSQCLHALELVWVRNLRQKRAKFLGSWNRWFGRCRWSGWSDWQILLMLLPGRLCAEGSVGQVLRLGVLGAAGSHCWRCL